MDPEMYKAWYARNQADGVPLPQMGLTGDPALDDKTARLIYAQGVKAKDQVTMQAKMHAEKEKGFMDESLRKSRESTMYHQRWLEANAHNNGHKGSTTNDAKLGTQQNVIYNKYITEYGKLKANYDKAKAAGDNTTTEAVKKQIDVLNSNFEKQKRSTSTAFGKQPTDVSSKGEAPKTASELFSKYNIPTQ
jgi:hypothetical protein